MNKNSEFLDPPVKLRNSSLELLRIVSMVFIIMHHYALHGGFHLNTMPFGANKILIEFLMAGGKLGVNCFVMITGYFMVNGKFSCKKIIEIIFKVTIYYFLFQVVFVVLGMAPFSPVSMFEAAFPILFGKYWFVNAYLLLYLLSPFLNKLIHSIGRKMHLQFIGILLIVWCIIPSVPTYLVASADWGWSGFDWTNTGWFILIYCIAAYIRLYPNYYTNKCRLNFCMSVFLYGIMVLTITVFYLLGGRYKEQVLNIMNINNLLLFLCSLTLFLAFKNLRLKTNPWVNAAAATMFGVYLMHEHNLVRPFLWKTLFKNADYFASPFLLLHALLAISFVFLVCVLVDALIRRFLETPLNAFAANMVSLFSIRTKKLTPFIKKCFDRTLNKENNS